MLRPAFLLLFALITANAYVFSRDKPLARTMFASRNGLSLHMVNDGYKDTIRSSKVGVASIALGLLGFNSAVFADELKPAPWNDQIQYEVLKAAPSGAAQPKAGEMVVVRFKGSFKGTVFDDTFKTNDPYFYRAGVGTVLPGVDQTVINMKVGDKYHIQFGGDLGFGDQGRASAPGRPRIPPRATLDYEIELESLPGTGDEFIADYEG